MDTRRKIYEDLFKEKEQLLAKNAQKMTQQEYDKKTSEMSKLLNQTDDPDFQKLIVEIMDLQDKKICTRCIA